MSKNVKPWRAQIAAAASQQDAIFDAPVTVTAVFLLKRPQRPKWERHGTRPDVDKLARALLDGLTGPLLTDDSIVSELNVSKRYALPHEETGVHINVAAW
ncbi:RusA family crossover junction endodeoxyribonuclease [Microbacterium plantarum]|uniref:RusA family crossover junction endodeoxyribonuclease n=1 Tax=Microbacterium plantarum TaxID=1816425 RepID=UPI002B464294|nr:RusA family crossover junction endodeoxyribonuclease [Microbacterium plantarum]WRK16520.1 RusA family crossover junction endodeoxyribonuclease [Microbacterium plantarum]